MKHLKKLSVVLMMATLFSVSFTSCIDNEVSPVVEAIYEAQADLIAAQAGVQNAEAALRLAQAQAEEAQAAYIEAQAAQIAVVTAGLEEGNAYAAAQHEQALLELVAQTNLNVAASQNALELAQVAFQTQLAAAIAAMEAAGAQLAVGYAWDYALAMNHANNLLSDLLEAKADLASAELMQNGDVSWEFYLAQLEAAVATGEANKADLETAIADMEAYIADPTTPEAVVSALKAQSVEYQAAIDAKEIEMQVQFNKIMAIYDENGVRNETVDRIFDSLDEHNDAVNEKNDRLDDISDAEEDIADWQLALDDYDAALLAAQTAVDDAQTAYDDAWEALGLEDASGDTPAFGLYFEIDADEVAIAAGGTKYATPANLQEVYVNARIDYLDASADLAAYQADFDLLVTSYNNAAVALANAQAAFDAADYQGDLDTAEDDLDTAQGNRDDAFDAYTAARIAFEADPTGSVNTDGPVDVVTDLGYLGIHTDGSVSTTYMRVATWTETFGGSGLYIPATFLPTKYTPTTLATALTNLYTLDGTAYAGGEVGAKYAVTDDTEVVLWNQDGTSTDAAAAVSILGPGVVATLTPAQVQDATSVPGNVDIENAYFVEVESDDTSVSKLFTFNVATNMLGVDDFSDRAIVGNPAGTGYMGPLTIADTDAGYDTAWDGDISNPQVDDALTAEAELWNAKLEVAYRTYLLSVGDDALVAAQEEFDYQQELFDNGVANLALLADDLALADSAQDDAQDAVDDAWVELGVELAEGTSLDTPVDPADTLNEILFNAEIALDTFLACDDVCLQANIDAALLSIAGWNIEIASIQPIIDAKFAVVAGLLDELTAEGVEYTFVVEDDGTGTLVITNFGVLSSLYPDIHAQIIAEWQAYWVMDQELTALQNSLDLNDDLILAYGAADDLSDLAGYLADLKDDLADAIYDIEVAKQALADAQVEEAADEAYITYLEALVTTLEQRYANTLAIAAKYKALMDAALAS